MRQCEPAQAQQQRRQAVDVPQLVGEGDALAQQRPGVVVVAGDGGHRRQVAEGPGHPVAVPDLAPHRQALLVQRPGGGVVTLLERQVAEVAEQHGDAVAVPELAAQLQALLVESAGAGEITLLEGQVAEVAEQHGDAVAVPELAAQLQALLVESAGAGEITLIVGHPAQVAQGGGDHLLVAELPAEGEALLEEQSGRRVALERQKVPQAVEGDGDPQPIAGVAHDGQALLVVGASRDVVTLTLGEDPGAIERSGPNVGRRRRISVEDQPQPLATLTKMAPHLPVAGQGGGQSDRHFRHLRTGPPSQRGPEVVVLRLQYVQRRALRRALEKERFHPLGQRYRPNQVGIASRNGVGRLLQPLSAVVAHGLRQPVPVDPVSLLDDDDRLLDQPADDVRHLRLPRFGRGTHLLGRLQGEPTGEDRQPVEGGPLLRRQGVVGPVDRRPKRLVAGRCRRGAGGEEPEAVPQARGDALQRQGAGSGRRQLQGQGDPVELAADPGGSLKVHRRQLEVGAHRCDPVDQEPHRLVLQKLVDGRQVGRIRGRQRPDAPGRLAGDPERLTARR